MTDRNETSTSTSLDPDELGKFAAMAAEWWDPNGKFKPLHRLAPARLEFVRDEICARFGRSPRDLRSLSGLRILDIGCGGGLMSEPLARLGAAVTGVDPARESIEIAKRHAADGGLAIDYRTATAEALADDGESFDVVMCLEVVEHVNDPGAFVATCSRLVRPGGLMLLSTINRTLKSYALAIIGAEHILRWLPVGTHQWDRFITPGELEKFVGSAGLEPTRTKGVVYDVLRDRWLLSEDTTVNYMLSAAKATPRHT